MVWYQSIWLSGNQMWLLFYKRGATWWLVKTWRGASKVNFRVSSTGRERVARILRQPGHSWVTASSLLDRYPRGPCTEPTVWLITTRAITSLSWIYKWKYLEGSRNLRVGDWSRRSFNHCIEFHCSSPHERGSWSSFFFKQSYKGLVIKP